MLLIIFRLWKCNQFERATLAILRPSRKNRIQSKSMRLNTYNLIEIKRWFFRFSHHVPSPQMTFSTFQIHVILHDGENRTTLPHSLSISRNININNLTIIRVCFKWNLMYPWKIGILLFIYWYTDRNRVVDCFYMNMKPFIIPRALLCRPHSRLVLVLVLFWFHQCTRIWVRGRLIAALLFDLPLLSPTNILRWTF